MLLQVLGIVAAVGVVVAVGVSLALIDAERDELHRKFADRW